MLDLTFPFKINSLFLSDFNKCSVQQQSKVPYYKSVSDFELVDLLKQNDRKAFSELYSRYAAALTGYASSKLYSLDDVHDLIQDIFISLWTNRHKLVIDSSLNAYLHSSVRYKIIDCIRKNVTREEYAIIVQTLSKHPSYNPEKEREVKDVQKIVSLAIEKLPPRVREIYQMSRNDHHTIAEIAGKLSLSEQTVKNQLSTATKAIKKTLSKFSILLL